MSTRTILSMCLLLATSACPAPPDDDGDGLADTDLADTDDQSGDTDDASDTDATDTDASDTDVPDTDVPDTDAPDTDAHDTDAADTDLPADTDTGPPVFRVRITPANATTVDALVAIVENVPPGTGVPFVVWSGPAMSFVFGDVVPPEQTHKGDTWTVSATMIAATGIPEVSDTIVIANSPPTVATTSLEVVLDGACGVLTCVLDAADADGDALITTYSWTVDGAPATGGATLTTRVAPGQRVACHAETTDGEATVFTDASEVVTDAGVTDADADGLCTDGELLHHTSDTTPDSDGDGRTDGDEVYIDRTDPAVAP